MNIKKWLMASLVFLLVIQPFYTLIGSSSSALAQTNVFAGGDGTEEDPYQITTAAQLNEVRNHLNQHFILMNDIDVDDEIPNWDPIEGFRGSFNGNWHVIRDLKVTGANNNVGLFSFMDNATIKNLTITNAQMSGSNQVGILAGQAYNNTVIKDVYVDGGTVNATGGVIGGLLGYTSNVTLNKVSSSAAVHSTADKVGGLIGDAPAEIILKNAYSTGNVNGSFYVGGLIGSAKDSVIENTYATGEIVSNGNSGGLIGDIETTTVINSFYDKDTTNANDDTGKGIPKSTAEMKVEDTYSNWMSSGLWTIDANTNSGYPYLLSSNSNLSNISISSFNLNEAFLGHKSNYTLTVPNGTSEIVLSPTTVDQKATVSVPNETNGSVPLDVDGQTVINVIVTAEDGSVATYTVDVTVDMSSSNGGNSDSDTSTPPSDTSTPPNDSSCISGVGDGLTIDHPIIICTAEDLDHIRNGMDKHYKLGQNIDLGSYVSEGGPAYNDGKGWQPIGGYAWGDEFRGTLDGDNYEIINLKINRPYEMFVGLFGSTYDAGWNQEANIHNGVMDFSTQRNTFNNLKLRNVDIVGDYTVGAIAASISRGGINNSSVTGSIKGKASVGALTGNNAYTFVNRSWSDATVTGIECDVNNPYMNCGGIGGLVGHNSGQINESLFVGEVMGLKNIGGLVGAGWNYGINNSYSNGTVTGKLNVGGIAGALDHSVRVVNSYSTSKIQMMQDGNQSTIGGLVGAPYHQLSGNTSFNRAISSYWDVVVSNVEGREIEYGTPIINSSDMMKKGTFENWDTENIWYITCNGESGYPALRWTMSEVQPEPSCPGSEIETPTTPPTNGDGGGSETEIPVTPTPGNDSGNNSQTPPAGEGSGNEPSTPVVTPPTAPSTGGGKDRGESGSSSSQKTETITVDVDGKNGENLNKTPIKRTTESNGVVKDVVTMPESIAKETAKKAADSGNETARIMIPDEKDIVSETKVEVPKTALTELQNGNLNLDIYTENVTVSIPKTTLTEFNEDLYFHLIPIKEEVQRKEVEDRARVEQIVKELAQDQAIKVVARPMTIETNMQSKPVTLTLPLRGVQLPTNEVEREKFLNELVIFIEHSDGEKELVKAKVVLYKENELGLEFGVNKFSTFTILHMEGVDEEATEQGTHNPYIIGFGEEFRPNQPVTRAQMARMLARNLDAAPSSQRYSDIPANHWVYEEVMEVKGAGIMTGKTESTFEASGYVTRAQMAGIAYRWIQKECTEDSNSFESCSQLKNSANAKFTDVAATHWATEAISFMRATKMMEGYEDSTFRPNENLTRAQAVKVLNDLFKRGPLKGVTTPSFKDVTKSHWAYEEIEEAARTHTINHDSSGQEILK